MTDQNLIAIIEKLNNREQKNLIFLRPLTHEVDYAKVWENTPSKTDAIFSPDLPYSFYFIKNDLGNYVAAVLDMSHDLHWIVIPEFRSNGFLSKSLRETILFHLFKDRDEQKISIKPAEIGLDNAKASERLALKVGFEKVNEFEYILKKDKYATGIKFEGLNREFDDIRIDELKKEINYIGRSLAVIQTELEMNYGVSEYSEDLKDLLSEIRGHVWKFEDFCLDFRENK